MKYKMKAILGIILVSLSILTGCYKKGQSLDAVDITPNQVDLPAQPILTLETYFPLVKDTVWYYEGDIYLKDMVVWVDFIKENVFQLHFKDGVMERVKVYLEEENAIYEVATIENATVKQDFTNVRQYKNVVLKLPIEKGEKWLQADGVIKTITDTDVKLDTALGVVNAIEVVMQGPDYKIKEYYGEKIGLIKSVYIHEGEKETRELVRYENNMPIKDDVTIYLGNKETGELEAIEQEITVRTNEEPKHFLTDLLSKVVQEQYIIALPPGTMINNIYVDEHKVTLDMNEAYEKISYEQGTEKLAIMSLVKTVGAYYGVNEVVLTVEESPYISPYILQKIGSGIIIE